MLSTIFPKRINTLSNAIKLVLISDYSINRNLQPGEQAPIAHQNTRVFPDWYKPYMLNYTSEGYFVLVLGGFCLFGYSYLNDIKEQKGRKSRKVWDRGDLTQAKLVKQQYAKERIAAGDPNFTKFLEKKERPYLHAHH
jgi:hypothetical protein